MKTLVYAHVSFMPKAAQISSQNNLVFYLIPSGSLHSGRRNRSHLACYRHPDKLIKPNRDTHVWLLQMRFVLEKAHITISILTNI